LELVGADPPVVEGDFLGASDFEALELFECGNELPGLEQAVVGAGVEPGVATAHELDAELVLLKV
jgi:hypothetical protein